MSKISTIAYSNGLLSLRIDDGYVFQMSNEAHKKHCLLKALRPSMWNNDTSLSFSLTLSNKVLKTKIQDYISTFSETLYKLADGNYEVCSVKRWSDSFFSEIFPESQVPNDEATTCRTAYKENADDSHIFSVFDFFDNHDAHRTHDCKLLVTYNNCTEALF